MNYFYHISQGKYLICDTELCEQTNRTFDIHFNDLANHERLLNLLCLYYIQGNYGTNYTHKSRAKWFGGYLTAFCNDNVKSEKMREKLLTNPVVRLLVEDKKLFKEINKYMKAGVTNEFVKL